MAPTGLRRRLLHLIEREIDTSAARSRGRIVAKMNALVDREVILYWRAIAPQAEHRVTLTLTATIPGEYTAPASRTYLYYTAEQKQWVEPLRVRIAR